MKIRNELFTTDEILNFRRSFTLKNLDLEPLDNTRIELIIVLHIFKSDFLFEKQETIEKVKITS